MPNDHTNGTKPGFPTPSALVADNDYGVGQLVDVISHSKIWRDSAIFVVEDDSQDGADHVDAHRMPSLVISPWTRHGAVVHTRYDQESVIRSIELVLGLKPLSLFDALATPMYDAFTSSPDTTPYRAIKPDYPLDATNAASAADAKLSSALPFTSVDLVPQEVSDRVLWHSVYGQHSSPPAPGPDASPAERSRAHEALAAYRHGLPAKRVRALLAGSSTDTDG
jgi:DNA-binding beta-propeller fold protein YncE